MIEQTSDEARRTLARMQVGQRFAYWYDFGDDWWHDIGGVHRPRRPGTDLPAMCDRAPRLPEDCGGPWGFEEMMGALGDEKHPEHEMHREWIPAGYDPARFDLNEINNALARLSAGSLRV
ncbi:MAG: plasmid pRiA4b ORF-3 family protein [Pseudonocardiaceae bacterium]